MSNFNKEKIFTPNEINKFSYCPYQWYYERKHGRKKLREMASKNKDNSCENATIKLFMSGLEYHSKVNFKTGYSLKTVLIIVLLLIAVVFLFIKMRGLL